MRVAAVKIVSFLLVAILVSCKVEIPEEVLPPEKMEAVLYDYHLTQSMASTLASVDYKEKLMYTYLYDKHNISKEHFDSSLVWYNRYPKYMKAIYENLEGRLQDEVDLLGGAKNLQYEGVDLDAANLLADVAELWSGHPVKELSSTPLNNRLHFSFDVPKDSTFLVGDSLVFSFNAFFIAGNALDVKQEIYASVTLEYNDDSYLIKGLSVKESDYYVIPVARNNNTLLKSMSGYVYYFDDDTTYSSKVLLHDLSLKRLHPVKEVNEKVRK